jgi:hypothetical protein
MTMSDWVYGRPGLWRLEHGEAVLGYVRRIGNGWQGFGPDRRTTIGPRVPNLLEAMKQLARRVSH